MRKLYVTLNGKRAGPYPEAKVVAALQQGKLRGAEFEDAQTGGRVTAQNLIGAAALRAMDAQSEAVSTTQDTPRPWFVNGRPMTTAELDAEEARIRALLEPHGLPDDVPIFNRDPFEHLLARAEHTYIRAAVSQGVNPVLFKVGPVGYTGEWPPRDSAGKAMPAMLVPQFHAFYHLVRVMDGKAAQTVVGIVDVILILSGFAAFKYGFWAGIGGVALMACVALAISYPVFLIDKGRKLRAIREGLVRFNGFADIGPWVPETHKVQLVTLWALGQTLK